MASATGDHRHLRLDSLPLIDLRLLSQSDLFSLSRSSSSSSSDPHRRCSSDDDVLIPKIDRSVFNESAGSRKQTFSRLRLAPRNSQLSSSASASSAARRQTPEPPLDQETFRIIGLLKQLFASETHAELVSVPVDYNDSVPESYGDVLHNVPIDVLVDSAMKKRKRGRPRKSAAPEFAKKAENGDLKFGDPLPVSSNAVLYNMGRGIVPVPVVSNSEGFRNAATAIVASNEVLHSPVVHTAGGGSQGKRKRGRPRKNEIRTVENAKSGGEKAVRDAKGRVKKKEELVNVSSNWNVNDADLVALGNLEDPFGEELRKRTQGLETEVELLGFLGGLEGEWGSWRRKKKIVMASEFGDVLPNGWKIMISLKRKEGRVSLFCRRYVSPSGQQFVSCKEVSSFLLSSFGLQDAGHLKPALADGKVEAANQVGSEDDANELVSCSRGPITSITDDWKQGILLETTNPGDVQFPNVFKCHHRTMTLDEKNDLVHHLLSSHKDATSCNTKICEGVIFKDGNYECQYCHKILDEKICYNGRVAVDAKDDMESIDVSQGLTSVPKNPDPSLSGVSPISLLMQESVGIDEENPSTVAANDDLSCSFVHSKLKADTVTETCIDRVGFIQFSDEEQATDGSKDKIDHEFCENQARVLHMTNGALERLDEAIKISITATSNNENKTTNKCSDGIDVVNCISISTMQEPKLDIDPQAGFLASSSKKKTRSAEADDIDYQQFTSRVEDGNDESISGRCRPRNEEECGPAKDANVFLVSNIMDSVHEKSTEPSFCSSNIDEKPHLVSNGVNSVSSSTFYESKIIGSNSNHVTSDTDAVTGGDHGRSSGSYLHVPPLNEQDFVDVVNTENPNFKMEEPSEKTSFQSNVFTSIVDDNNVNNSSIGVVDVRNCKGSEFSIAFDSKDKGIHVDTISCIERDGKSEGDSLNLFSYEDKFASKDSVACNTKMDDVKQERDFSDSDLLSQFDYEQSYDGIKNVNNLPLRSMYSKNKEVRSLWNKEVFRDFGSSYTGMDASAGTSTVKGRSSEGFSLVISGSDQTFSITNNVPDTCSSTVEELKLKRASEFGLIHPSGSEQIHAVGNTKSEDATTSRNNELMIGLGKHARTFGDVMPELIWKTDEQNFQLSRLADTSSAPMQLSGCYSNSNIFSDEGAYGNLSVDDKVESISDLVGLGSSSTEQLQYNFLTAQGTSNSYESEGFSHADMNQGFDSSFWLAKEESTLFPKTASTHETIAVCVWCSKEFYHQVVSSGTELDTMGIMCATCQAKFSG